MRTGSTPNNHFCQYYGPDNDEHRNHDKMLWYRLKDSSLNDHRIWMNTSSLTIIVYSVRASSKLFPLSSGRRRLAQTALSLTRVVSGMKSSTRKNSNTASSCCFMVSFRGFFFRRLNLVYFQAEPSWPSTKKNLRKSIYQNSPKKNVTWNDSFRREGLVRYGNGNYSWTQLNVKIALNTCQARHSTSRVGFHLSK